MKFLFALTVLLAGTTQAGTPKKETKTLARTTASAAADNFSCAGTEPFWGLTIKGAKLSMRTPDATNDEWTVREKLVPLGVSESFAFVLNAGSSKGQVTAVLRAAECNDGMSEEKYSHELIFIKGSTVFYGCCKRP